LRRKKVEEVVPSVEAKHLSTDAIIADYLALKNVLQKMILNCLPL
jgi:hypothetical protein